MNKTRIYSIITLVVALGLGYYLFNSIKTKIDDDKRIKLVEANIIEKLKLIREAQIAYQKVNGQYTGDWNNLMKFIKEGNLYLTQRTEIIIPRPYGGDSIVVKIDTLGSVKVLDSLFAPSKYPNLNIDNLPIIPGSDGKRFEMFADKIMKSGIRIDVVEVKDIAPINPRRSEKNDILIMKPLRFGSRVDVTTAGNWE